MTQDQDPGWSGARFQRMVLKDYTTHSKQQAGQGLYLCFRLITNDGLAPVAHRTQKRISWEREQKTSQKRKVKRMPSPWKERSCTLSRCSGDPVLLSGWAGWRPAPAARCPRRKDNVITVITCGGPRRRGWMVAPLFSVLSAPTLYHGRLVSPSRRQGQPEHLERT